VALPTIAFTLTVTWVLDPGIAMLNEPGLGPGIRPWVLMVTVNVVGVEETFAKLGVTVRKEELGPRMVTTEVGWLDVTWTVWD